MNYKNIRISHAAGGSSINARKIWMLVIAAAVCLMSTGLGAAEEVNLILELGDMDDGEYFIKQTIPITAMYFSEDNGTPIIEANISFHIYDFNNFDLYLYAHTDSNGFATVYFVPEEAGEYIIDASVVAEINNFERQYLFVEPFIHSYKEYIFPPNTIQTVKYTLIDKDLNPIENVINFQFGSINDNILPLGGTIEYSINSSNFGQDIELNNSFSGYVNPTEYIIDVTNRYIDINPGTTISYFMRVFDTNNAPIKNTNFTIVVDWWNENDEKVDETIFNVTTNNYGLSEFEITVPSGVSEGEFAINKQSDFEEGLYASFYGFMYVDEPGSDLHFDIDTSDWDPNYNEEVIITFQLHNSSKYYSNIPIYLYVNGSSVKLITDSNGEASFAFTSPAKLGNNMIYAMTYISEEGGLWHDDDDFFVAPAEPHIGLSLNGNVVDINVNMMDNTSNLIPNSPAIFEFVRTPNEHWRGTYEDIISKYIQPASGTYTDQITLNKYGRYEGYVGWGWYDWYDAVYYTPFEYSTNLESVFSSGQDNYININVMKNGIPLTSGSVYLKCYLEDAEIVIHDFVPIDSNGNAVLTFSPPSNEDEVHITIGVSTEVETYDLLDTWIELEPSTTISGPVHNINKGTNYTTIQAAIDDASLGDEIHVDSGTYYENVLVNKSLKLIGENKDTTIINGSGGSSSIKLENVDDCIVSGFTLTSDIGIFLTSSNNNTVSNNNVSNNNGGILLTTSSSNTISNNNVSNNNYGILLTSSNSNTISNITANLNAYVGIHLYFSSRNTISNNTANSNKMDGIYLLHSSSNKISNNNASDNPVGILLSGGDLSIWKKNVENNHYYLLLPRMHWLQAEANAEEWGGHLVTVNDAEENLWLRNQFGTEEYFWIGFNDIKSEGDWEWVSGEPVTYTNWRTGEPNDKSGDGESEDAAIMNWGGGEQIDGEWFYYYGDNWNDVPINSYSRSIVEADSSEYMGTYLYSSSNNTLTNNIVNSNALGIGMDFSSNNTLDNNTANSNTGRGIDLHNSSNNLFNNNTANWNNDRGIKLMYSKNNILTNNTANYNIDEGIYLDHFSNNNILNNNTASWNFDCGIHLDKADNNILINNVVYWNNDRGIHLYNSSNNILMENLVSSNNNTGIHLSSSSSNNTIYYNNIINNSPNAIDYSSNNYWNASYPVGGNYWDDYADVDQFSGTHQDQTGSDGIGDTPYNIGSGAGAQDRYPLMQPWNESGSEFISIGSANALTNSTITIPVSVANATNISGISFNLLYNSSVAIVNSVSANANFTGSSITQNIDNVNGITNIVLTNSNLISASVETPVIDIAFNVTGGSGSSTSLDLQNVKFSDANSNPYPPAVVVNGQITIGIKGDFNGNGRVDIGDVAKVAFMVAGKVPEDLNADFNNNGRVDIGDAAKIAFYLAGKVSEL